MTDFAFIPSVASLPYTFQPTLDGQPYSALIWWNVQAQRCYITVSDLSGNAIFTLPLIASPLNYPISITYGYFTSTLVYYPDSQKITVNP